jgi:phage repressor protein C with HTH and peptisase S24 domain
VGRGLFFWDKGLTFVQQSFINSNKKSEQEMQTKFGPFFQRVSQVLGIASQQELAGILGVNRSAVTQAKQRDTVPDKWLHILSRTYGLQPEWLTTGRGPAKFEHDATDDLGPEFLKVPKVRARLSAGGGSFEVNSRVEDYYAFKRRWLDRKGSPNAMVLMDVFGNSMEPEIKEGDTVLVDQKQSDVIAGGVYAIGVEDTVMVKRIEKRPNTLVLLSDNTDYAPIMLQGDELQTVRVIGKVVWICREYR